MLPGSLTLRVDEGVSNGNLKTLARPRNDVQLKPARLAVGLRRDQDLVRGKSTKRLLDRLQRVGVPDHAVGIDTCRGEEGNGFVEPARGFGAPGVFIRAPVQGAGVERRCDQKHLGRAGPARFWISSLSERSGRVSFASTSTRLRSSGGRRAQTAGSRSRGSLVR